jgi:alpha-amylase/alpha-mannosidase (GH57 family)
MTSGSIFHALGLHMHQPPGNLRLLLDANPWEAEQIIRCYERPVRYAGLYPDVARLHLGFSGVLLEQLLDPGVVDRYRHIIDIPEMLDRYQHADNIELVGMGYYHPVFPLIPPADWAEQLERGREAVQRAFGRSPRGFWPPEMAFTMAMVPALIDAGYEYVVVDGVHVRPEDGISDVFRPYLACHDGVCISIVARDRDVSNAQQSGLDTNWFQNEVRWRTGGSPRPHEARLVTTWTDGENGGWFRQTHEGSGFFGHFFAPYMEKARAGDYPVTPVLLGDYLRRMPPVAQAQVQTGAWNVGSTSGEDLSQWAGSPAQRAAVVELQCLSARYWDLLGRTATDEPGPALALARARHLILEAETSCFLFWGDAWVPYLCERTRAAGQELDAAEAALAAAERLNNPGVSHGR